jgi:hypothetical protein
METRALGYPLAEKPGLRKSQVAQRNQGSEKPLLREKKAQARKPGRRETRAQGDRGSDKSRPIETKAHGSKPGLRTSTVLR